MRLFMLTILVTIGPELSQLTEAATFHRLGPNTFAADISADGSTAVGALNGSAFRWQASKGLSVIPSPVGATSYNASAVSADGNTIVGSFRSGSPSQNVAFSWTEDTNDSSTLGTMPDGSPLISAFAISSDGTSIFGQGATEFDLPGVGIVPGSAPYKWQGNSVSVLSTLGGRSSAVLGSSADGSVLAGSSQTIQDSLASPSRITAARWNNSAVQTLSALSGSEGSARAVSADGQVIVGSSDSAEGHPVPVKWSSGGIQAIPLLSGNNQGFAQDANYDGSVIVGWSNNVLGGQDQQAFVWTNKDSTQPLTTFLMNEYGLNDLNDWTRTRATAISDNGQVILGQGTNPSGQSEAFVADLREASLLFRETGGPDAWFKLFESSGGAIKLDIPGLDHAALNLNQTVYESHGGYDPGEYLDPGNTSVALTAAGSMGVINQHTLGTFKHNSTTLVSPSQTLEVPIPIKLGESLAEAIDGVLGTPYPSGLNVLSPSGHKGPATFACSGLLEWASEQVASDFPDIAILHDDEGFVPNEVETISILGFEINTLSPNLIHHFVTNPDLQLTSTFQIIQAVFDPVDFLITDPLGRRIGYTAELGEINEIPDSFFSGDGALEQLFIGDPIQGEYNIELIGLGEDVFAAIGSRNNAVLIDEFLAVGERRTILFSLTAIPEPDSIAVFITGILLTAIHRRQNVYKLAIY